MNVRRFLVCPSVRLSKTRPGRVSEREMVSQLEKLLKKKDPSGAACCSTKEAVICLEPYVAMTVQRGMWWRVVAAVVVLLVVDVVVVEPAMLVLSTPKKSVSVAEPSGVGKRMWK